MVDLLKPDVPLETTTLNNVPYDVKRVPPANRYFFVCKHQSDLSKTPSLFHLMLLGVGSTTDPRVDYHFRYFESRRFSMYVHAS
jgi:hypothetical protein